MKVKTHRSLLTTDSNNDSQDNQKQKQQWGILAHIFITQSFEVTR